MKSKHLGILFVAIMLLSMVTAVSAGEQTKCPVMGGEIDKSIYVEQDGKRIYMCCEGCREELEENFSKYEAKLKASGQDVALVAADVKDDHKEDCKSDCKEVKKADHDKGCSEEGKVAVEEKHCGSGNCGSAKKTGCDK